MKRQLYSFLGVAWVTTLSYFEAQALLFLVYRLMY